MTRHRIEIAALLADKDLNLAGKGHRAEIENTYKVVNGRVTRVSQFQGEMVYVPYYWDFYLAGMHDHEDGEILVFYVRPADRKLFPELKRRKVVRLMKNNQGFVREVHPR